MRYLNAKGQIAWNASPLMLQKLVDAEREVEDDLEESHSEENDLEQSI